MSDLARSIYEAWRAHYGLRHGWDEAVYLARQPDTYILTAALIEAARIAAGAASKGKCGHDRVIYDEDGRLDEIVGSGGAHLECLGYNNWWLKIYHGDGSSTALWWSSEDCPVDIDEERPAETVKAQQN